MTAFVQRGSSAGEFAATSAQASEWLQELEEKLIGGIEERAALMAASGVFESIRDGALHGDLRKSMREFWDAFLRSERRGTAATQEELAFIREWAVQHAREMVPLPKLVEGLLMAQRNAFGAIAQTAGSGGWPDREAAQMMFRLADFSTRVISNFVEAYTETMRSEHDEQEVDRADMLDEMLAQGTDGWRWIRRRAAVLGVDTERAQVVVVCRLELGPGAVNTALPFRSTAEALARLSGRSASRAFVVVRKSDVVAVLGSQDEAGIMKSLDSLRQAIWFRHHVYFLAGVGALFASLNDFRASYDEAARALRHASQDRPVVRGTADLTLIDDFVVSHVGAAQAVIPEQIRRVLAEPTTSSTLLSYLAADGNVADAARRLNVHPNTVRHRLARVAELSGRDPRIASDLFELTTAARIVGAGVDGDRRETVQTHIEDRRTGR